MITKHCVVCGKEVSGLFSQRRKIMDNDDVLHDIYVCSAGQHQSIKTPPPGLSVDGLYYPPQLRADGLEIPEDKHD